MSHSSYCYCGKTNAMKEIETISADGRKKKNANTLHYAVITEM